MCHNRQLKSAWNAKEQSYSFDDYYTYIAPYIQASDFAFGNLETVLEAPGASYSGFPHFNSPKSFSAALQAAGFDLLTAANNPHLRSRLPRDHLYLADALWQQIPVCRHSRRSQRALRAIAVGTGIFGCAYWPIHSMPISGLRLRTPLAVNTYSEEKGQGRHSGRSGSKGPTL